MQNMLRFFCGLAAAGLSTVASAQINNTLGDRPEPSESVITRAHARSNSSRARNKSRAKIFKRPKVQHTAVYEFYARVEQAAKEKQRMLRKMDRPQYTEFAYFGHRQPPKKRAPHKKRFCTECGIRH